MWVKLNNQLVEFNPAKTVALPTKGYAPRPEEI